MIQLLRYTKAAPRLGLALGLLGLGACGRRIEAAAGPPVAGQASKEVSYLAPPRATGVTVGAGGMLRVTGSAPPLSRVEITSPEGEMVQAATDRMGAWSTRLAATPQPRLYAISAMLAGRTVHAEGALVTAPGAVTPAVTVRAGYAAMPLGRSARTDIMTIDYDPAGFIAVAGAAAPGAELTLAVDGTSAAVSHAGALGRYALLAENRRLVVGRHLLQVQAPDGGAERAFTMEPPAPLTAPYQAWPGPDGWRVEWALNGGGVQTTLILAR